jgi:hypothetical protein
MSDWREIQANAWSKGAKEFSAKLQALSEVFVFREPENMTFRNPETLVQYRAHHRHVAENKWVAIFGDYADCRTAIEVLSGIGISATKRDAPDRMFAIEFDGPDGA